MADVAALSTEQKRILKAYHPSLGVIKPGFDIGAKLDAIISLLNQSNLIISGAANVADGATTVLITIGAAYDGKPVAVTLTSATSTLYVKTAVWNGSGVLTVTVDQDPAVGAGQDLSYIIDGR